MEIVDYQNRIQELEKELVNKDKIIEESQKENERLRADNTMLLSQNDKLFNSRPVYSIGKEEEKRKPLSLSEISKIFNRR